MICRLRWTFTNRKSVTNWNWKNLTKYILVKCYYSPYETDVPLQKAYMYADLLVFSMFADVITDHWYMIRLFALGMKIRVACCSLIYRKCLKQRIGEGLNGSKIINQPSNDANRFDLALLVILFVWVTPVLMLV
jgi:ATP-binding cassette subfamily C (CFTR/MRP) protein 4